MMLTLLFYATWYKFLLGGPLAPVKIDDAEFCNDNWWTNLLLVHNLVNRFQKVTKTLLKDTFGTSNKYGYWLKIMLHIFQCVSWTWYVACVFQLHIVTLIFVLVPIAMYVSLLFHLFQTKI